MDAGAVEQVVFDKGRLGSFHIAERNGVDFILGMIRTVFPRHDVWAGTLRGPTQCVIFGTYRAGRNKPVFAFYGPKSSGANVTFGLRFEDKKLRAALEGERYSYHQRFELGRVVEDRDELQKYLQWSATKFELAQRMEGAGLVEIDQAASDDILRIAASKNLEPTVRKQMVDARIGQGKFRDQVLTRWGGCCAVTGSGVLQALRASHIVAWNKANDEEKLDPENGLPLVATLDALFDRGLVSFAEDGTMLIADELEGKYEQLGIRPGMRLLRTPSEKQKSYLGMHRHSAGLA